MKKILSFILATALILTGTFLVLADGIDGPKKVSGDATANISPSDWAKEDVERAIKLGILDGDKTYYYGTFITREEFCELIYDFLLAHNIPLDDGTVVFEDTDSGKVSTLAAMGIIKGISKTQFAPDNHISREQAATIITRVLKIFPNLSFTEMFFEYDDSDKISDWAMDGIQLVSNAGIMKGYSEKFNVFSPKDIFEYEMAVVTIMRMYDYINPNIKNGIGESENLTFADRLNSEMPKSENYMFSPLSIKMALAMAANGAEGETQRELLNVIDKSNIERFNDFSKKTIDKYSQSDKLTLNIANSVWVNTDNCPHDFEKKYKDTVSEFYNAKAGKVSNSNAVKEINSWTSEKTNGKIPSIIEDSDFWAALVNAIYFKGSWEKDFNEKRTKPDTFTSADGTKTKIDFMNQTDSFSYHKSDEAEIVKLRYKTSFYTEDKDGNLDREVLDGMNVAMYLIKTDSTNIEDTIKTSYDYKRIALSVPKFKVDYSADITELLGLNVATSKTLADFSGMMNLSPDEDLWIDKVLHKTYISVDEKGTEAAAVTAVMMAGATSAKPEEPIEVKFNEPFYFVIRDDTNGEILFMGRYAYAE